MLKEVFEYMEGDVKEFGTMTPEAVKKMEIDATVILSQDQGQRAIEKANLALQTQQRFFESPPEMRPLSVLFVSVSWMLLVMRMWKSSYQRKHPQIQDRKQRL